MTIHSSSAETTSGSKDFGTADVLGGVFFLDVSARSGTTPTLDVKFQYKDPISSNYVDIPGASFTQKNATGTDTLTIYPGVVATANRSVSLVLPDEVRAVWTIGGTTPSFTFTLAFDEIRD